MERQNERLREREAALLEAVSIHIIAARHLYILAIRIALQIDELSNQNEDLIEKLKESMERELIQRYPISPCIICHSRLITGETYSPHSSKRAAQISHSVSALVLPDIVHRDTPDETAPAAAAKRSSRKK